MLHVCELYLKCDRRSIWRMPSSSYPGNNNQGMLLRTPAFSLSYHFPCLESKITSLSEFSEAGFYPRHNEKKMSYKWLPFIYYQGNSVHLRSQDKMEGDCLREITVCSPTKKFSTVEAYVVSTATISI